MQLLSAWRIGAGSLCALILSTGCVPPVTGTDDSPFLQQVLGAEAPRPPASGRYRETEPNDDLTAAEPVTIDGSIDLEGTIRAAALDRDLYELGPADAGDRITAELTIPSDDDAVLGVLSEQGELLGFLDLSSRAAGPRTMDITVREATGRLYAIVTTRAASASERGYTARVELERAAGVPASQPQVVVLNFSGAPGVRVAGRAAVNVPAFDAARISPRFTGQTGVMIQTVASMVRESLRGVDVQIHVAGEFTAPAGPRSTVYFGTYDSQLLGLADNVDPYNSDLEQNAILYTDTFALFDVLSPDLEAIAQALANTAAHEIGHLLGLRHTSDVQDIMDTTASARQMMVPQWFKTASLNATVMPFGLQNAPNLLSWTLGGQFIAAPDSKRVLARQKAVEHASGGLDFYIPRCQWSAAGTP